MREKQSFTKIDIAKDLAQTLYKNTTPESQKKCVEILDKIAWIIGAALINEKDVEWQGLLAIKQYILPERRGRNPQTGEVETYPAKRKVRCHLTRDLKHIVCDDPMTSTYFEYRR